MGTKEIDKVGKRDHRQRKRDGSKVSVRGRESYQGEQVTGKRDIDYGREREREPCVPVQRLRHLLLLHRACVHAPADTQGTDGGVDRVD